MRAASIVVPFLLLFAASACNVTKHIPAGETLYGGATVKVHSDVKKDAAAMKTELPGLVRPKPNTSLLGFRYKLWFYYVAGEPRGKGLRAWVRNTLGEPPVLTSQVNREKNRVVLQNRLENRGFFHGCVTSDTASKGRITTYKYDAVTGPRYHIRTIVLAPDSMRIDSVIRASKDKSLLVVGDPYDLDAIKAEHARIDIFLKNNGYYYFSPEYFITRVDSTEGEHQVDVAVDLKRTTPLSDAVPYYINNIWVYSNYNIQRDSLLAAAEAVRYKDYSIIDPEQKFKPRMFERVLVFNKGDVYSRADHNRSLNRLVNLGTYKFVKARFEEVDTDGHYLDPYYFLTPLPRHALRAELSGLTKSNNATGTEVALSYVNRNFLHGAENLTVSIFGGAENQVYGGQNIATLRYGTELNLTLPRILAPFRLNTKSDFVSRTRLNLRVEFYDRSTQYTLNSYRGSYGFVFKSNIKNEHRFDLIDLNYVQASRITPQFQLALDTDVTLSRSIAPQFILGPSYNYNYNSNNEPNDWLHNFYFNANFDAPGNILGIFTGTQFNKETQGSGKFLNKVFSQYARVELDGRYYLRIGDRLHKANVIATRLNIGYGMPYGNSDALPFIKAFFIGGVNDLRAFRARALGPGSYYARLNRPNGFVPDQPGDIKLLASAEVRAKLIAIINGAAFIDAGNIWTINDDPQRPGSRFTSKWLSQIAAGAGVGIRADIGFLVVRVDLATPIRKPFLVTGPAFVLDQMEFGSSAWRRENLILNLALGYPF